MFAYTVIFSFAFTMVGLGIVMNGISYEDETKEENEDIPQEKNDSKKQKTKYYEYIYEVKTENKKLEKALLMLHEQLKETEKEFEKIRPEKQRRIKEIIDDNNDILKKYMDSNLYTKEKIDRTLVDKIENDIRKIKEIREATTKDIREEFKRRMVDFEDFNRISRIDKKWHEEEKKEKLIEGEKIPMKYRKKVALMNIKNDEVWKNKRKLNPILINNLQYKNKLMNEIINIFNHLQEEEKRENEFRLETMYLNIQDLMRIIVKNDIDEELLRRKIERGNEK